MAIWSKKWMKSVLTCKHPAAENCHVNLVCFLSVVWQVGWWSPAPTSLSAVRPTARATELRASEFTAATAMTATRAAWPPVCRVSTTCCSSCPSCSTASSNSHHIIAGEGPSAIPKVQIWLSRRPNYRQLGPFWFLTLERKTWRSSCSEFGMHCRMCNSFIRADVCFSGFYWEMPRLPLTLKEAVMLCEYICFSRITGAFFIVSFDWFSFFFFSRNITRLRSSWKG